MTERLLQYIWQFQYYNTNELKTSTGELLSIVEPGTFNTHQGPDFCNGKIRLSGNLWVGNIELHVNASDWAKHRHTEDPNYNNVILHVVWNNDHPEVTMLPTLVLGDRVPKVLLTQYAAWMKSNHFIPCEGMISRVDPLIAESWKDRLLIERLTRRIEQLMLYLRNNKYHWEEVLWQMIARNFGLHVNADAFGEMATSVSYAILKKHKMQMHQLESLLFGQCGLLDTVEDDKYAAMLKKEYQHLKRKYGLEKINVSVHFLRMRPCSFPTVRLAQLAMLIYSVENLFSLLINAADIGKIRNVLSVTANDYWHYHYRFGETALYQPKTLGTGMINNIIINTVVPMLFAYGTHHNEDGPKMRALRWMNELPAESNSTISGFKRLGLTIKTSRDSQALLEMKSQYCDNNRCLDCAIACNLFRKQVM